MMRWILALLIVIMVLTMNVTAYAGIMPVAQVTVTKPYVVLADIFSGVDPSIASTKVMPSPQPGQHVTLSALSLVQLARAHQLQLTTAHAGLSTMIQRRAEYVTRQQLESELKPQLQAKLGHNAFEIQVEPLNWQTAVSSTATSSVELISVDVDQNQQRASARIRVMDDGTAQPEQVVSARIFATTRIPVLSVTKQNGEVITDADVAWQTVRQQSLSNQVVQSLSQLVGMTPRQTIQANETIRMSDLAVPQLVSKNGLVTVVYDSSRLQMKMHARALQNGRKGEIVKVMNINSKRTFEAEVINTNEVRAIGVIEVPIQVSNNVTGASVQ